LQKTSPMKKRKSHKGEWKEKKGFVEKLKKQWSKRNQKIATNLSTAGEEQKWAKHKKTKTETNTGYRASPEKKKEENGAGGSRDNNKSGTLLQLATERR